MNLMKNFKFQQTLLSIGSSVTESFGNDCRTSSDVESTLQSGVASNLAINIIEMNSKNAFCGGTDGALMFD
jgi:hypothetical protein